MIVPSTRLAPPMTRFAPLPTTLRRTLLGDTPPATTMWLPPPIEMLPLMLMMNVSEAPPDKVSVAPPPRAMFWTHRTFCPPLRVIVWVLFSAGPYVEHSAAALAEAAMATLLCARKEV